MPKWSWNAGPLPTNRGLLVPPPMDGAPSECSTFRTYRDVCYWVAFGGKADISQRLPNKPPQATAAATVPYGQLSRIVLYYSRDCRRAGRGLDARANRRGYPPRKPFASKENTSAHPVTVPVLYRRGRALSCRHHAQARCATHVTATAILLDRGWGKAPQPHTARTARTSITIRDLAEGGNDNALTSTYRTTPVSDEPLAASQARRLRPPDRRF